MNGSGKKNSNGTFELTLTMTEEELKALAQKFQEMAEQSNEEDVPGEGMQPQFISLPRWSRWCVRCHSSGQEEEFRAWGDAAAYVQALAICGGPYELSRGRCR